jgi:protein-tyrosine phosphatase
MPSILFVCTANQFRSPLAAACFLKQAVPENHPKKWRVESAGTWGKSGLGASAIALDVAASLGLDGLDLHRTRQIGPGLLARFDLVLVMEQGHKEAICAEFPSICRHVYLLSEVVDGFPYDIPDPGRPGVNPAEVGSLLSDLISRGKSKIQELAESLKRE